MLVESCSWDRKRDTNTSCFVFPKISILCPKHVQTFLKLPDRTSSWPAVLPPAAVESFVKMAKKSKKGSPDSINSRLQLVMKSGKVSLGHKSTVKSIRSGKGNILLHLLFRTITFFICILFLFSAKLVIISSNCPAVRKSEIEYYAMLAKAGVHHYHGGQYYFCLS